MTYGIIEYNAEGKPKCELCGQYFDRVSSHVRQKHHMTALEYKQIYGFNTTRGIVSEQSKLKSREATLRNHETTIEENLLNKGQHFRFTPGHEGRTKNKMSEETRLRLKARLKTEKMKEAMKKNGERLGKSGLGNLTRWGAK